MTEVKKQEEKENLPNDTTNDKVEEEKQEEVKEEKSEEKTEKPKKESTEKPEKKDFKDKFFKKNFRKKRPFRREKPEFDQKILSLRRVTRVMAGGRRFSFSVAMVVGDKKGRVGVGLGKANDTTSAIKKAVRNAKKNMVKVKLTENGSIPYEIDAKYKASKILIRPVTGKGLAAGGAVRTVLEFAGMKEVGAKIISRSKNHFNNAKATILALEPFSEKVEVIEKKRKFIKRKPFRREDAIKK